MGDKVTGMEYMFMFATSFNNNIAPWNTDKVTSMSSMFRGATSFNHNIAPWNTDKVTDMWYMFHGATSFNHNLCEWLDNPNFPNNIDTGSMFYESGCDVTINPTNSYVCQWC